MSDLVTVVSFTTRLEAEIAKSALASQGIQSTISADDAGGMRPFPMAYTTLVELKVKKKDKEKALKILSAKRS